MSVPIQNQPTVRFSVPIQPSASSRPDQSSVPDAGVHLGPAHAGDLGRSSAGLRLGRASILFLGRAEDAPPRPLFRGAVHRRGGV
jgi:hypothetical protein